MAGFSLPSILTVIRLSPSHKQAGQPGLERRIAVLVGDDLFAIQVDDAVGHGPIEDESRPRDRRSPGAIGGLSGR